MDEYVGDLARQQRCRRPRHVPFAVKAPQEKLDLVEAPDDRRIGFSAGSRRRFVENEAEIAARSVFHPRRTQGQGAAAGRGFTTDLMRNVVFPARRIPMTAVALPRKPDSAM